jgi:hypothetical protein
MPGVNMTHSPDRSCDSSDRESIAGDHSTHGDMDLAAERQTNLPSLADPEGNARLLESLEPTAEGVPEDVADGHTGLPPDEAIKKPQ